MVDVERGVECHRNDKLQGEALILEAAQYRFLLTSGPPDCINFVDAGAEILCTVRGGYVDGGAH